MKRIVSLLSVVLLILLASQSFAQLRFGVKAGLNFAKKPANYRISNKCFLPFLRFLLLSLTLVGPLMEKSATKMRTLILILNLRSQSSITASSKITKLCVMSSSKMASSFDQKQTPKSLLIFFPNITKGILQQLFTQSF